MTRGLLTVDQLRARCCVDRNTGCWHWLGAKSGGQPRIFTFDHAVGEKRPLSGPKAAWNIAHGEAPRPGWFVYRRCVVQDCLAPVHLAQARTKAEIGLHVARSGKRKGTALESRRANAAKGRAAQGKVDTPLEVVREIRAASLLDPSRSNVSFAREFGVLHQTVSQIRHNFTRLERPAP